MKILRIAQWTGDDVIADEETDPGFYVTIGPFESREKAQEYREALRRHFENLRAELT
jgi:SPOR domain